MGHFGEAYGRVGKWFLVRNTESGFLPTGYGTPLGYLYGTTHPNYPDWEPQMPTSSLMQLYGATLWGRRDSPEALMGTVHAFGAVEGRGVGHSHQNTGSIHIAGYGEHLIFNSSVLYVPSYPGQTPDGDPWSSAWLQNSVLIGERNTHDTDVGNGLTGGLTGGSVEFGRVDSGVALGNGQHFRTLFHVHHSPDTANGYFVLLDEVKPDDPTDPIRIALHPNSNRIVEVASNQEFRAPIDLVVQESADGTEAVTIMYATPPSQVNRRSGYHAAGGQALALDHLEAIYLAGSDGWLRAVTVLFPEDGGNQKAAMHRLIGLGYSGVLVDHGSTAANGPVQDVVLASDPSQDVSHVRTSFRGTGLFYRQEGPRVTTYAVTQGRMFDDGATQRTGFHCDEDINLQMDGGQGHIESDGTTVTFFAPGLTGVLVDGQPVGVTATPGRVEATIPAGRRGLTFEF